MSACRHCGEPLAIPAWDRLNGFLVPCPHCRLLHGRRWNVRAIALASLVLNAASFFFTMRPARALMAMTLWFAASALVLPRAQHWPESAEGAAFAIALLGPLFLNGALLVRHQVLLDRTTPAIDPHAPFR